MSKNYGKAFEYFEKAAHQKNKLGIYKIGTYYENGLTGVSNSAKAAYNYEYAADLGHVESQFKIGFCYKYGNGVLQDLRKAK